MITPKFYRFDKVRFKGDSVLMSYPETYIWVFIPGESADTSMFVIEHPQGQNKSELITQYKIKAIWADQLKDGIKYLKLACDPDGGNKYLELIESYSGNKQLRDKIEIPSKSNQLNGLNLKKVYLYRVLNALNYPVYEGYDQAEAEAQFIKYADQQGGNYYMKMCIQILEQTQKYLYSKKQGKFLK